MKELKEVNKEYLEQYDIHVNRYLTYSQIQAIANSVRNLESWAERKQNIDMLLLAFATDILREELENHTHDYWLNTGVISDVYSIVNNWYMIEEAINYEESPMRMIIKLAKEIPDFNKKVDEVLKNASSKKQR